MRNTSRKKVKGGWLLRETECTPDRFVSLLLLAIDKQLLDKKKNIKYHKTQVKNSSFSDLINKYLA